MAQVNIDWLKKNEFYCETRTINTVDFIKLTYYKVYVNHHHMCVCISCHINFSCLEDIVETPYHCLHNTLIYQLGDVDYQVLVMWIIKYRTI